MNVSISIYLYNDLYVSYNDGLMYSMNHHLSL